MNKKELFWNSSPIGIIEDLKNDIFKVYGKWNPYRSIAHLNFMKSLRSDPEPRIFIGSKNSELNGTLCYIEDGEIEINIGL